jgi:hypothetical protein
MAAKAGYLPETIRKIRAWLMNMDIKPMHECVALQELV